ncbi:hypothetical protein FOA52_006244 [Chlamydomonas sp. UWO 241]|nr:hypothetical protein FOA52_006244 [Chlamydomonas sp. UWO 241]
MEWNGMCGVMEAVNVPHAAAPIVTFWEGEIVDNANNTFLTNKWGASRDIDMKHWSKFSGFVGLEAGVARGAGRCALLATAPQIFMRWKETMFVNASEACGLTIAGFYYVCLDRQTGTVIGYYFDPNSAPFQFLSLKPCAGDGGGMSFGSYALA